MSDFIEVDGLRVGPWMVRAYLDRIKDLEAQLSKAPILPKGEPMPQTIEAWQRLYGLAEQAMLKDKAEIEQLKLNQEQAKDRKQMLKSVFMEVAREERIKKLEKWLVEIIHLKVDDFTNLDIETTLYAYGLPCDEEPS